MNILVVGNIIKDIYLNFDSKTTNLENDKNNIPWLNLSFNASEHFFFNRNASLGGAAVTLEVLEKLGLTAKISGSNLSISADGPNDYQSAETYRYILVSDGNVCYFAPTNRQVTTLETPNDYYDYIYIDRSANLTTNSIKRIVSYLDFSHNTKLVLYLDSNNKSILSPLISQSSLIFFESTPSDNPQDESDLKLDPSKTIYLSEKQLSYQNINESISVERINTLTHLSTYSILSATILGCFILGKTIEDSFKLARINAENAKLNASLPLDRLEEALNSNTTSNNELMLTAAALVLPPKGILAADESGGSIHKKFNQLNIEDNYDNRRNYRNILLTTPDLEKYVNGVILFDETARQYTDDGELFINYLTAHRIIPGIKVDQGLTPLQDSPEETYTKGLDNLSSRLKEYYKMGLRFAKWRAAFNIHLDENNNPIIPTEYAISENCRALAEYAKECQLAGIVPIVEPEVVYDGYYSLDQNANTTSKILDNLFANLSEQNVNLSACILKTNMILPGKQFDSTISTAEIGAKTASVLREHVPSDLAGVAFLSGGQTPEQATDNLEAIIKNGPFPWPVTFSFARALQDPALYAWQGDNNNTKLAQDDFTKRLIANVKALSSLESQNQNQSSDSQSSDSQSSESQPFESQLFTPFPSPPQF